MEDNKEPFSRTHKPLESINYVKQYKDTKTRKELATELNISENRVYFLLRKLSRAETGLNNRQQKSKKIRDFVQENKNKLTKSEMAEELGVHVKTINEYLREMKPEVKKKAKIVKPAKSPFKKIRYKLVEDRFIINCF